MNFLKTPKMKLYAALALLAALGLAASTRGFDVVTLSRWVLGLGCVVGLGIWMARQQKGTAGFKPLPRLQVLARTGLSPKCSLALVEADGKTLLVAFGDGFAQFADAPVSGTTSKPAPKVQARRVAPKSRRPRKVVSP
ncbi:MAG: hypothetical protein ACJ790_19570 [Myxococcaceae bacterium]